MKARGSSDPLAECRGGGHPKYEKIKDINAGAFGFVQLCRDKETGEKLAIKFMERGHKITKVCRPRTPLFCEHLQTQDPSKGRLSLQRQ